MSDTDRLLSVLRRRRPLLAAVSSEPRTRHELVDAFDHSTSTVYKGLAELEEFGLVQTEDRVLSPTPFGLLLADRFDALVEVADLGTALSRLPTEGLAPVVFDGAEIVTSTSTAIDRHHDRVEELIANADRIRGIASVSAPRYVTLLGDRLSEPRFDLELVLTTALAEQLRRTDDRATALLASPNARFWVVDRVFEFSVGIYGRAETTDDQAETTVAIELQNGSDVRAVVVNDSEEAVRWAIERFERARADANEVR